MAINITATSLKSEEGFSATSCHIRVSSRIGPREDTIALRMNIYRNLTSFNNNEQDFWPQEIPNYFSSMGRALTPAQYANLDMDSIQTRMAELLEQGDAHANWDDHFAGQTFAGLSGTYAVVMPS